MLVALRAPCAFRKSARSLTIQRYEAALLFLKQLLLVSSGFQSITTRVLVDYFGNRRFLKMCLGVLLSETHVHSTRVDDGKRYHP